MQAIVVSDLHIGLPCFRKSTFLQFVEFLDVRTSLILNGDIVDDPRQRLEARDQNVLDFLVAQSFERSVVWIYVNHDEDFRLAQPGGIEFRRSLALGTRLLIVHGDDFDTVMPSNRWFLRLFKICHIIRLRLGAHLVHVAELAEQWAPMLYRVLTEQVKKNAVDCALENGFGVITCGHTHYAEDSILKGVRYINTGTWTQQPLHYLSISPDAILLESYSERG